MSYASHEGVLRSTTAPLTMAGANQLATMTQVLGLPNINYVHNPDEENPSETLGLQRALDGKNAHIGLALVSMMTSANPAMLRLFPVKRTNTLTHEYHYIDFPKEFAVETSPGSAPGYPTFAKSKRTATLSYFQMGATTTFQELRHSEGVTIWYGKLITMVTAFIEMAEMLVVQCLLETPSYYAEYFVKTGKHEIDLARAGRLHDLFFDILHRRDNGMALLVDAVRSDMQNSRSIVPTDMLISEGIATLSVTNRHTDYYMNGPGAAQNALKLTDAFPEVYDGIRVTKVRPLDYREKRLHINMLERNVQIGQNFALDHFHAGADLSQWTTNWLSIGIYSMETDDWAYIGMKEALDNCGRFDRADGRLTRHHYTLAKDPRGLCKRSNVPLTKDNRIDMFIYETRAPNSSESTFNVATVFGQMESWALSDEAVERTGETIVNYLRRTVGDDSLGAIGAGLENINELYERSLTQADVEFLDVALAQPAGKYGVPSLADPVIVGAIGPGVATLPAGYGTVAGYHEIAQASKANVDERWIAQAQSFVKAAKRFYRALKELFPCDHIALDPKYAPSAFRSTANQTSEYAAILTLFQNIVDSNKLTLGKAETGAAARPALVGDYREVIPTPGTLLAFTDSVTNNVPAHIYERFKTKELTVAFANKFLASSFASAYADGQQRARRARGTRGAAAASLDVDGAPVADVAAPITFGKFLDAEFAKGDATQRARLLAAVVDLVDNPEKVPRALDVEALRGAAGALPQTTTARRIASGLAVPLDAIQRLGVAGDTLVFASPYNDGGQMTAAQAAALSTTDGANANIMRTAFHVQSKARAQQFSVSAVPPLFAQSQFTNFADGEVVINQNLQKRFDAVGHHASWLVRVARQMLLLAPICLPVLHAMCRNNVMPPVAFLLEQPWRRYRTSTVIFLSRPAQGDIGNVLVLDPDVTLGYNAITKQMVANGTMYLGAIAMDCQNWYVAHDVAVVGYDGGESAKLFDLLRQDLVDLLSTMPRDGPSILPFMVPPGSVTDQHSPCKVPASHNIRGFRSPAYYQANSADRKMEFAYKPMHPSAPFYTSWLNLQKLGAVAEDWKFHQGRSVFNTETHRGLALVYDIGTRQHDRVIMPQDQFKTAVYPGCRELRLSTLSQHYKDLNYEQRAIGGF